MKPVTVIKSAFFVDNPLVCSTTAVSDLRHPTDAGSSIFAVSASVQCAGVLMNIAINIAPCVSGVVGRWSAMPCSAYICSDSYSFAIFEMWCTCHV